MSAFGGKADSASDCRGQSCGASRILHAAGASDLVLRNVNTRQFEVYDIVNNQITSAFNIGAVGLDFQLGGFAVDPPTVSGTFTDISSDQLAQNGGFGGGAADNSNDISLGDDMSQHTFLTAPHA